MKKSSAAPKISESKSHPVFMNIENFQAPCRKGGEVKLGFA